MKNIFVIGKIEINISIFLNNKKKKIFSDSKLTRILQDSLCGKTITSIIITLSPANETVN